MDQEYERRLLRQQNGSRPENDFSNSLLSPVNSPVSGNYGDRFIPCRSPSTWQKNFSLLQDNLKVPDQVKSNKDASADSSKACTVYPYLLHNELIASIYEDAKTQQEDREALTPIKGKHTNLFNYKIQEQNFLNEASSPYSLSPVSHKSQKLLRSPKKTTRKISKMPFKVLDAPNLRDDFYLNLVDWSSTNILSVGLGTWAYLWSARTSLVTPLCDLSAESDSVTSVSWSEKGNLIAVGTQKGYVQVWDVASSKRVAILEGHSARVGALAWNGDVLSSGSRDRFILNRDVRCPSYVSPRKLVGHRQEVCGLKWSPDNLHLASGGNDNKLLIWNMGSNTPVQTYHEHLAAVKAIAWSPHHHGLLASGGGTADQCIRFWNTLTAKAMQRVDTGSQVCNLAWSKHASELVSTHGFSQNQILVWKYPSLTQVAKLTGHSSRVLYLAMSPDGESIVTGAGDETLRLWHVFSKAQSQRDAKSALNLFNSIR